MSHPEFFPDVLTGQLAPTGTGLNLYRNGRVVFSGTLSEESLCRVLAFFEQRCKPIEPPKCEHCKCLCCWQFCHKCNRAKAKASDPELSECKHCFYPRPDPSVYSARQCCHCGKMQYC